jgi:hypothetical protein
MAGAKARQFILVASLCALSLAALAQRTLQPTTKEDAVETSGYPVSARTSGRLLTADEGLAIIGAALEIQQASRTAGDCSHVVHAIYESAGFRYGYADSSQLYTGIEDFQRVTHPQPGDLAVWRGHAAIVVNPVQHTFFGSTRSGLRVESYDLEYWKRQGPPRFFRYVKAASLPIEPGLTRTATGTRPTLSNAESRMPLVGRDSNDPRRNDVATEDAAALIAETVGHPLHILVHARQPKLQQVNDALSLYFDEIDKAAGLQDLLRPAQPLLVFDRIEVKDVHLKGRQAWADVKLTDLASLSLGHMASKKSFEQQRWALTRLDANTWELQLPPKTAYLSHDRAVRILAHQLAALADGRSDASDSSEDQTQLARMLNALLEK